MPRLCIVGPLVGRHAGYVTTQSLILSDLFAAAGYPVIAVSDRLNRYHRLAEIAATLVRRRKEYDILILDVFGGPSFVVEEIASGIARAAGRKIVMFLRGGAMPEFMARHPRWTARVLARADLILTPSPFLERALAARGIGSRVLPNVIDLSAYPHRHRRELKPRLFWMRSFHPVWNPGMAVRVLAKLGARTPAATLVMAGEDKGLQEETRRLAEQLGVADRVRFAGYLDRAGKRREGEEAEIYLNTNRIDNMPVSVLEAGAMGIPVVATNVGGIPDLLEDGETALLVPDEDADAMARAVERLLDDPALTARLSANGRALAERCSWREILPQWERIFAELREGR
ncbi:MAG: glycosyltransferase family 4 protein [Blastocatellia bacterium]|nr:glycosyltransferase family 4 protein [Blastocatellia bacterium]